MKTLALALMLTASPPAECPHSVLCQAAPDPFAEYYERRPKSPQDILVCVEGEVPGVDCNCVGSAEDTCALVEWTDCDTDSDCEIKSRSPYGFNPWR
jgi:hypothetical protein